MGERNVFFLLAVAPILTAHIYVEFYSQNSKLKCKLELDVEQ